VGLNLNDKKAVVAEVSAQVANAQTIAIAEYRGIEVGDLTVLRKKARESGVYLRVLKNTLVRRAVADTPFAGLADHMVGPLIYSVSADPVAGACFRPEPRRAALQAAVRHASSGRRLRPRSGCPGYPARRSCRLIPTAYELI
jgi:hypothetical protein